MNKNGNYTNTEFNRKIYKEYKQKKVFQILKEEVPKGEKVLFVFWHGLGDILMFLPIYNYFKQQFSKDWQFDLCCQPGVGQNLVQDGILEMDESVFVKNHHTAFVINFPMNEGMNNGMTKAEYCCNFELGIPSVYLGIYCPKKVVNRLVGVHLQGTCLPGSTNPDEGFAKALNDDLKKLGYIPIDVHFEHSFHNPVNKRFDWQFRSCRDLAPNILMLQSLIQQCHAFIGVASGPFVLATALMPKSTIYLQKSHDVSCYLKGFENTLRIGEYSLENLKMIMEKIRVDNFCVG